jgi:predicted nucleic acid-binding protein
MPTSSVRGLLADTNFWLAAFDRRDQHHEEAAEVLRTRTVKNTPIVRSFERVLRRPKVVKLDDRPYRTQCLEETITQAPHRPISLVDMVVRAVLADDEYEISQLLTFDPADFVDVCKRRGITVWPYGVRSRHRQ